MSPKEEHMLEDFIYAAQNILATAPDEDKLDPEWNEFYADVANVINSYNNLPRMER